MLSKNFTVSILLLPIILLNISYLYKSQSKTNPISTLVQTDTSKTDSEISAKLNQKEDSQSAENMEEDNLIVNQITEKRDSLVNFAKQFLGKPYWYGGTGPQGFDCSGFAQFVFKKFNYNIPRISGDQAQLGKAVKMEEAQAGDLVYYGYPYGKTWVYTHTAVVYANDKKGLRVIHAYFAGVGITGIYFDPNWRVICIKRLIG